MKYNQNKYYKRTMEPNKADYQSLKTIQSPRDLIVAFSMLASNIIRPLQISHVRLNEPDFLVGEFGLQR